MRLTLRTLLAFLDDTLDPTEARMIGQKIAESSAAQELIDRIKKVTRRRSLANPPVLGDNSNLDPNTVAEYLDDSLSPDEVAQVEQTCLEQDVYLAEVAACHQILTLMLSEPARVPPPARQRMYGLVKGRESIPYRKPPAFTPKATPARLGEDDVEDKPDRWEIYAGLALLLAIGLALAVYFAWPTPHKSAKPNGAVSVAQAESPPVAPVVPPVKAEDKAADQVKPIPSVDDKNKSGTPAEKAADAATPPKTGSKDQETAKAAPKKKDLDKAPVDAPSDEQKALGKLTSANVVLLRHDAKTKGAWNRVLQNEPIRSSEQLLSLPGFRSEIKCDNGLVVTIWGSLPELTESGWLESAATLYSPASGFDLDMNVDRGRILVANPRDVPAQLRARFEREIVDVTLVAKSELLCDVRRSYPDSIPFSKRPGGEPPLVEVALGLMKGKAQLRILDREPFDLAPPPGQALVIWNNKTGLSQPRRLAQVPSHWLGEPPYGPQGKDTLAPVRSALAGFAKRVDAKSSDVELVLTEMLSESWADQLLGIYGLAAIDSLRTLLDKAEDTIPVNRIPALVALRNWCSRNAKNDLILHGLLQEKKGYSESEADTFLELMHLYSKADLAKPATYQNLFTYMDSGRLAIRTLAVWHMAQLDADGLRVAQYDPDADSSARQTAIARWKKRIPPGKLPPKSALPSDKEKKN